MTFLKTREPVEVETSAETEVEGEIREFVRRDVVGIRRQPESDSELVANNINQLLQRVAGTSVQEIDKLITELQTLRDTLQAEAARVQREIVEYATLSQAALQSTKIIAESLTHWKKVPDAPSLRDWGWGAPFATWRAGGGRLASFLAKIRRPIRTSRTWKKAPLAKSQRGQVEGGNAQEGRR
jgi:hypothetical protein